MKKMIGTFHVAIGANTMFGGKNAANMHEDFVCISKYKLTDKPVTVCQELFEKIQIKKGVTTKPKSSNNFEC